MHYSSLNFFNSMKQFLAHIPFKNRKQAGYGPWVVVFADPYMNQQEIHQKNSRTWNNAREHEYQSQDMQTKSPGNNLTYQERRHELKTLAADQFSPLNQLSAKLSKGGRPPRPRSCVFH